MIRLPEPKYEEAEAAETGAAPADTAAAQPSEGSAWEAAKATALAKAQAAAEQAEAAKPAVGLVEDAPAPAKEKPSPAAKARRMAAKATKEQAATQEPARAETPQTAAGDELVADQDLDDPTPAETAGQDEDLGEPEPLRPRSKLERLRLKAKREQEMSEWQRKESEWQQRIAALEQRLQGETSGLTEAQRLYREGKVDDALERVFGEKFSTTQTRFLEGKGAMSRADRELAELKAERDAEKARAKAEAEQQAQQQAYTQRQQAYIAERKEFLDEAATSPYREIRELAKSPIAEGFGDLLLQSVNTPEYADRDMKFHYQVARNAYRELHKSLDQVFRPVQSTAPTQERESPARPRVLGANTPDQPGVSAAKPQTNSPQAEARGGRRRFSSEAEAWEAHTKALRIG